MPTTVEQARRLKEAGYPQMGTCLVWIRRRSFDGKREAWSLERGDDRMAGDVAHTVGAYLSGGLAVEWLAAPEACEILKALPAKVGRNALRIERTSEGWKAGYGKAKAAEGRELADALFVLATGAFDGS